MHALTYLDSSDMALSDREHYLTAVRTLTIQSNSNTLYRCLLEEETLRLLLSKIFKIIMTIEQQSLECLSNCIWILCNLACESGISPIMVSEFDIYARIESLFTMFYGNQGQNANNFEANLLEQILWLLANVFGDGEEA